MNEGILVVNKPKGMTSHDVVVCVRRKLNIRKVGHAGTLDPMATGVLLVLVGGYTKYFNRMLSYEKEYAAELTLGARTSTGDADGEIVETRDCVAVAQEDIRRVFSSYLGAIDQVPPMVSAKKYRGSPLYKLARKGIEVERKPVTVTIKELCLIEAADNLIRFSLKCSSGTYVRKLGEDIAKDLGNLGYLSKLERRSVGPFTIERAVPISGISCEVLTGLECA